MANSSILTPLYSNKDKNIFHSITYLPAWKFEPNVVTKFQPVIFPNAAAFFNRDS